MACRSKAENRERLAETLVHYPGRILRHRPVKIIDISKLPPCGDAVCHPQASILVTGNFPAKTGFITFFNLNSLDQPFLGKAHLKRDAPFFCNLNYFIHFHAYASIQPALLDFSISPYNNSRCCPPFFRFFGKPPRIVLIVEFYRVTETKNNTKRLYGFW
jgi:hypothetical protein